MNRERRLVLPFLVFLLSLWLAACGGGSGDDDRAEETPGETVESEPSMPREEEEDPAQYDDFPYASMKVTGLTDTEITVEISSRNENSCTFGEWYALERKEDGEWSALPYAVEGDIAFHLIGYDLEPGESGEWSTDFEWLYGSLEPGNYRIVKDILDFRGSGDYDKYYLTAEFTVEPDEDETTEEDFLFYNQSGVERAEAEETIEQFLWYLENDNREAVAAMIAWPRLVSVPSEEYLVETAEDFLACYDRIFLEDFIKKLLEADHAAFCHDGLISFGNGEIWFYADYQGEGLKISTVNGPDGCSVWAGSPAGGQPG